MYSSRDCILRISSQHMSQFGLKDQDKVTVRFGSQRAPAMLESFDGEGPPRLSPALRIRLRVPPEYYGRVQYDSGRNEIAIGPLIGLLSIPLGTQGGYGNTPLYRSLHHVGKKTGAFVYSFTPGDVDWQRKMVRALAINGGQLQVMRLPLPDVIYNRVPNRGMERTPSYRLFLRNLANTPRVHMFNPRFFNKWQVHRWLSGTPEAKPYLPETRLMRGVRDLETIVQKHRHAYVKPVGGSLGKGIIRVYQARGGFVVAYRSGHRNVEHRHDQWSQAVAEIFNVRHRRSYVVQQGLSLAKYAGSTFDVRVTMHRDGNGSWVAVGPAAKIASGGAVTTHVHNGGRVMPLKRVLQRVFPGREEEIYSRVMQVGQTIAEAMEKGSGMELGELGLDLGITPDGRVYHFESNAKPGRMIFAPNWARRDRFYSLQCVCDYAAHVSGFDNQDGR